MKENKFKLKYDGKWYEGAPISCEMIDGDPICSFQSFDGSFFDMFADAHTLSQYSEMKDKNCNEIYENDIVEFLGERGQIVFEKGAFGISFDKEVPWDKIERVHFHDCDNDDVFGCFNNNFISLWEISWIFDDSGDVLRKVKVIGNIFDNPELETYDDYRE